MGLSSKQVSSDRHGWNQALLQSSSLELPKPSSMKRQASQVQQQQQQSEALKCPRCDSSNTKFCYYNNYNKSQPRHFCKACKRHWTKGGTLRSVPVGGGRKNKRLKTSNSGGKAASKTNNSTTNITTTTPTNTTNDNIKMLIQNQQQKPRFNLPICGYDEKNNFSEAFYQTLVRQPPSSLPECSIKFNNKGLNDGIFLGSTLSLPQNHNNDNNDHDQLQFPYSNLGSFESNPCSISSSNIYNYTGDQANGLEETVMNSLNNTSSSSMSDHHQPWTSANSVIDMSSNWGWDDFDKFVSVEADLSMPWDETEIKPPGS